MLTNFNQFSNKDPLLRIGSNFFKSSSNMTLYEARSRSWRFQHMTMRDPLLCNGLKSFLIFSMWRCVALYFVMVSTSLLIFSMWQCVTLYFVMVSTSLLIFKTWRCVTLYFVMVSTSLLIFSMWRCVALYFVMVSTSLLLFIKWWLFFYCEIRMFEMFFFFFLSFFKSDEISVSVFT